MSTTSPEREKRKPEGRRREKEKKEAPKMSMISSFLGSRLVVLPSKPTPKLVGGGTVSAPPSSAAAPLVIECSSRPQKKGTAHHIKTRPKKTQPWDIKRKPTVYAPLPKLPPEWSFAPKTETSKPVAAAEEVPSSTDNNDDDA